MAPAARSTDPVSELIKKCQKAAADKQYDVALDIASKALRATERDRSVSAQTRVTLLDLRTALYIRTEDYDLALKDAKAMIRIDRSDGRGYIRCGQIERLKGNRAAAVTFYQHGLKHVAGFDQYSQLIAKEMASVKEELRLMTVLAKAKDPMTTLPLEVVEIILSHLSYRQHIQMLRVCKAWKRLLCSLPPVTDTLAFPGADKAVTPKMLHPALRRLKEPKRISAHHLTATSSEILSRTLQAWQRLPQLQHLEIQDKWLPVWQLPLSKYHLRSIILGPETAIPFDLVPSLLKDCASLEVAQFKNVTGSRLGGARLDLRGVRLESQTVRVLHIHFLALLVAEFAHDMLFSGLPGLRALSCMGLCCPQAAVAGTMVDFRHMQQMGTLEMERCTMPGMLLPPSLRRLRFTDVLFHEASTNQTDFTQLNKLESLVVYDCPFYPAFVHFPAQTTKPGTLEDYIISTSYDTVPNYRILFETAWSAGLKRVHIKGDCIYDDSYKVFLEHCPALEELCLDGAKVTGLFVSDMIRANPAKLRKIVLRNCDKVSGDVVSWAKDLGVEVELIRGGQEPRGRRVRYGD